ncbi:MAG: PAS domain S-box protein [Candidatus Polarisedimenticolia bacterium]
MTIFEQGPFVLAAAIAWIAGGVAIACAVAAVAALRRMLRRTVERVRDLRRHPLIGDLPPESDAVLRLLTAEFNHLLLDLRGRVRPEGRGAGLPAGAFDGPPDVALLGLDPDYAVVSFSRGASALSGWEPLEILDRHVEALFAPGEWERILPKLARRTLRETGIAETVRLLHRDGREMAARVSLAGAAAGGDGPGLLMVARDLSAEQALERRLRESEERYRSLVEGIGDGVFMIRDGTILYANPAFAELLGKEREILPDTPFRDCVHARDLLRVLEVIGRAERGDEPGGEITCLLRTPGGSVEVRLAWAATEFGGRRVVLATVADIGARARFERALTASESRLDATLQATGDGILVMEPGAAGFVVTLANRCFGELFGLDPERLRGLTETDLRAALGSRCRDPEALGAFLERGCTAGEARLDGLEVTAPRRALLDLIAGAVRTRSGGAMGTIVTARDVTGRVEAEEKLHRGMEELQAARAGLETACRDLTIARNALTERNVQLEKLNTELRSLDEMKSSLLANVSHELHTPLVSIKGYTEMILKRRLGPLTPEQERGLAVALRNIDRLVEMIDNLLSFSRMEKGETQLRLEDVPFWQMVDEAIEMVGERIKKRNLQVTTQYETEGLTVRCDRNRITQVLVNLLTNAVKFNRDGGGITLTTRRGEPGFLEVDVADTGIGIPPEAIDRIFERFYQVDGGAGRRYEGTGIGLSIVRDILRLHGAGIRVRSEVGKGSVFTLTLPLARTQEVTTARPPGGRGRSDPD